MINDLRDACEAWQGGRDGGSSPIRAGARVLTNTRHYFAAPFIAEHERKARADERTLARARALLAHLDVAPSLDAAGWAASVGSTSVWAGRGIKSGAQDSQILETLESGELRMPLWGVSLDERVARSFGERFVFQLLGPFPAIAAWLHSGVKDEEQELIAGGLYRVHDLATRGETTHVQLRFERTLAPELSEVS